jgi:hypothetical protein
MSGLVEEGPQTDGRFTRLDKNGCEAIVVGRLTRVRSWLSNGLRLPPRLKRDQMQSLLVFNGCLK